MSVRISEQEFLSKPHRLLREVFRNFDSFQQVCVQSGDFSIEYVLGDTAVFLGLTEVEQARRCILTSTGRVDIPERHRKAVLLNVMRDMTQKDVSGIIGDIKPVAVGQHVEVACEDLARYFFPEWYSEESQHG